MFSQNSVSALATELDKLSRILGNKDVRTTFNGVVLTPMARRERACNGHGRRA